MPTAFAYARVSTKDQDAIGNSIPEQFARIESFAQSKGIEILRNYRDTESAYHDNREQFKAMIEDAKKSRPAYIIMDDSSRFARTRQTAIETKATLRKHNVNICFVNEPVIDPNSVAALWFEGIQEIKNEATSREIAFHVMKGMSHNLQVRDPETGWCYKNGGRAPYGYKTVHLTRGQDHKGKPIIKTVWEPDPETAPIVHMIIVDMMTVKQMSYRQMRDELNTNGTPGPTGEHWGSPTLVEMLKENRLEQYAGTAYWNKEDKHTLGTKYKPRDQWISMANAHPAIITQEELAAAMERKRANRYKAPDGATRKSTYLLTGNNFEGNPLFSCGNCGGNVIGYGNSSHNWKKYICGVNRSKGAIACDNKWLVDRDWLEQRLLTEIEERYTTPERVDQLVNDIASKVSVKNKEIDKVITTHQAKIKEREKGIKHLLDAIKSGVDASLIADEVNALKQEKDSLEEKIISLRKSYSNAHTVDINALRNFFQNFGTAFRTASVTERRELFRTFIRHIELVPETKEIRVEFYPDHVVQSIGAGDRT